MLDMSLLARAKKILAQSKPARAEASMEQPAVPDDAISIEPAAPNARPIFWERATGEIWGPAHPEFLAMVGHGLNAQYWVVAEHNGVPVWVNSMMLRSQREFEAQVPLRVVILIREPR